MEDHNMSAISTSIPNIEIKLTKGGQLATAMAVAVKVIAREGKSATLRIPFD